MTESKKSIYLKYQLIFSVFFGLMSSNSENDNVRNLPKMHHKIGEQSLEPNYRYARALGNIVRKLSHMYTHFSTFLHMSTHFQQVDKSENE